MRAAWRVAWTVAQTRPRSRNHRTRKRRRPPPAREAVHVAASALPHTSARAALPLPHDAPHTAVQVMQSVCGWQSPDTSLQHAMQRNSNCSSAWPCSTRHTSSPICTAEVAYQHGRKPILAQVGKTRRVSDIKEPELPTPVLLLHTNAIAVWS